MSFKRRKKSEGKVDDAQLDQVETDEDEEDDEGGTTVLSPDENTDNHDTPDVSLESATSDEDEEDDEGGTTVLSPDENADSPTEDLSFESATSDEDEEDDEGGTTVLSPDENADNHGTPDVSLESATSDEDEEDDEGGTTVLSPDENTDNHDTSDSDSVGVFEEPMNSDADNVKGDTDELVSPKKEVSPNVGESSGDSKIPTPPKPLNSRVISASTDEVNDFDDKEGENSTSKLEMNDEDKFGDDEEEIEFNATSILGESSEDDVFKRMGGDEEGNDSEESVSPQVEAPKPIQPKVAQRHDDFHQTEASSVVPKRTKEPMKHSSVSQGENLDVKEALKRKLNSNRTNDEYDNTKTAVMYYEQKPDEKKEEAFMKVVQENEGGGSSDAVRGYDESQDSNEKEMNRITDTSSLNREGNLPIVDPSHSAKWGLGENEKPTNRGGKSFFSLGKIVAVVILLAAVYLLIK